MTDLVQQLEAWRWEAAQAERAARSTLDAAKAAATKHAYSQVLQHLRGVAAAEATGTKVLTEQEATTVHRPTGQPWCWPKPVLVMISDTFDLVGFDNPPVGDGGPLTFELAVRMLTNLYRCGYVLVEVGGAELPSVAAQAEEVTLTEGACDGQEGSDG